LNVANRTVVAVAAVCVSTWQKFACVDPFACGEHVQVGAAENIPAAIVTVRLPVLLLVEVVTQLPLWLSAAPPEAEMTARSIRS
jgi:hypothetical protein